VIKVGRHAAADMAALEQAGLAADLVWRGGEALRALGRQLRERGGIAAAKVPKWFTATLRPYQQRGVDWLQFLREAGLAGVLADDMGLGKTVQTLAHLAIEKQAGRMKQPALVVCPTSVVGNWAREAERFAPRLRVLVLQGTDRKRLFGEIADSHVVISTYPLLSRDDDILSQQHWHMLILDEAQTVKNPAATMAQTVRRLHANQRICLTGTPMENHLGELWALFDFMMPGFLGSQQDFGRRFRTPIEKGGDAELHATLAKRVAPFLLRRTKGEVASDLPARTEIVETVQMQASQRAVYEAIRLAMHTRVQQAIAEQGLAKSGIVILDALLKMRQACCDPRLLKMASVTKHKAGSAKLDRLLELVTTLLEEGRAILLFSQFTSMLALIEESLGKLGIAYCLLTGETRDRASQIDAFQAGKKKLFLISLKAGGVGLNLTAADTVIHYDPWWNPAVENQATDRAHRIGQTKSVFVHRLITENTIEEKMEVLKARKSALAEGILTGAAANALKMTEADIDMLFG
jgi:SNF2 family DNA or RNA helicase